jgi:hypothetical protein
MIKAGWLSFQFRIDVSCGQSKAVASRLTEPGSR